MLDASKEFFWLQRQQSLESIRKASRLNEDNVLGALETGGGVVLRSRTAAIRPHPPLFGRWLISPPLSWGVPRGELVTPLRPAPLSWGVPRGELVAPLCYHLAALAAVPRGSAGFDPPLLVFGQPRHRPRLPPPHRLLALYALPPDLPPPVYLVADNPSLLSRAVVPPLVLLTFGV